MATISVSASVDLQDILAEISDEDLAKELDSRDSHDRSGLDAQAVYEAMARGNNDQALQLVRDWVQDATGRILP